MDVDLAERDGVGESARAAVRHGDVKHEVSAEHDHACDPEKKDIGAGDKQLGGVEGLKVRILLVDGGITCPAKDAERQQAGGEPGVEDVGLLTNVSDAAAGASGLGVAGNDELVAGVAVPGGDAVTPPELA